MKDSKLFNLNNINELNDDLYLPISNINSPLQFTYLGVVKEYIADGLNSKIIDNSNKILELEQNISDINIPTKISELENDINELNNISSLSNPQIQNDDSLLLKRNDNDSVQISGLDIKKFINRTYSKNVLWLGTSIPAGDIQYDNNGTTDLGTNNYPKMVADALGFNLYNNSRPGSFMFCYPVNSDIANALSNWSTADEVDNMGFVFGYSLTQSHADVETIFRDKLNSLRSAARKPQSWVDNHIADFKAHSYESLVIPYIDGTIASCDTVIIDHGFNDRDNIFNTCGQHRNDAADNYSYWPADQVGGATVPYPVTDGNVGWDWLTHLSDSRSYSGIEWMNALRYLAKNNNGGERTHYFGAMAWLIERIWEVNPRIKIIIGNYYAINYWMGLDGMATFRTKYLLETNEQIAKFYGLQCVNVYKYTGLRGWAIKTKDGQEIEDIVRFCPDGVHPHSDSTGESNRVIADIYCKQLIL